MADIVSPDQIRHKSFRTSFRGFDQAEVVEFLDAVAKTIDKLEADRLRLSMETGKPVDDDLQAEFQRVSAEVGEILEAARVAAEGMRERATVETNEQRSRAEADTAKHRLDAQADAEALRGDAWTTAKQLLDQSTTLAEQLSKDAEKEALAVVGHAERESHRSQASGRREAEELVRTAKMESERLLVDARAQHDEIIDTARKQADAAQERARALEVRRDELLAELETVRAKISVMESDIEERREPVPADDAQPATVRLIPAEQSEAQEQKGTSDWSPRDTVRIIPKAETMPEPVEPVDASSLAEEVRRLRDVAALAELADSTSPEGETEGAAEDETEEPSDAADAVADDDSASDEIPDSDAVGDGTGDSSGVEEEPWALDSLFATLRTVPDEPAAAPEYPPEEVVTEPPVAEAAVREEARPDPTPVEGDPISVRDQSLLPITNRVLRSVKRQLTEAQNLTLEDVRVNESWNPESVDLTDRIRGDALVLVQESFAAGLSAAGTILDTDTGRPKPAKEDIPDHSEAFSSALTSALAAVAGSAGEQGPRALSASLSRVYRAWRTDEAERRLRDYAVRAFHRGMLAGASRAGTARIRWVTAGRGCTTCRAAGKIGTTSIDSDFPGIDGMPPAHPGCACTIVPA